MTTAASATTETASPTPAVTPLDAARQRQRDLLDRMRAGDATVTADDFARAESAVQFATAQEAAAAERAQREAEQARQDRISALVRELVERDASPTLERATVALRKALDQFAATCASYNARHGEIYDELSRIGTLPAGVAIVPGGGIEVPDGPDGRPANVQHIIARNATEALTSTFPRMSIDLGRA